MPNGQVLLTLTVHAVYTFQPALRRCSEIIKCIGGRAATRVEWPNVLAITGYCHTAIETVRGSAVVSHSRWSHCPWLAHSLPTRTGTRRRRRTKAFLGPCNSCISNISPSLLLSSVFISDSHWHITGISLALHCRRKGLKPHSPHGLSVTCFMSFKSCQKRICTMPLTVLFSCPSWLPSLLSAIDFSSSPSSSLVPSSFCVKLS